MKQEVMIDHVMTLTETILGVVEGDATVEEEDGSIEAGEEGASGGEEEGEVSAGILRPPDTTGGLVLQETEIHTNIRMTEIAHHNQEGIQWVRRNSLLALKGDLSHLC